MEQGDDYVYLCRQEAARHGVVPDVHPDDFIFRFLAEHPVFSSRRLVAAYYFDDGAKSAEQIGSLVREVCGYGNESIELLEFAAGFGCVTRHLKARLPAWRILPCDIHAEAVRFLRERLSTDAVQSDSVPESLRLDRSFDVVFCLSFFSHMPKNTFARWMNSLASFVRPNGYLIFTTHGTISHERHFCDMTLDEQGFAFRPGSEQRDLDPLEYGTTVSSADFVLRCAGAMSGFRLKLFHEGAWWNHQDLYVLRRVE